MISKTLSPENQLKVRCPVFPTETKIAGCFMLRDLVYRGEGPTVRQGCQCAILAGKCPIPQLVKDMVRDGSDDYHAAEPRVRDFDYKLNDRIGKVLVSETTMQRFTLTPHEEKALVDCNARAHKYVDQAPKKVRRADRVMDFDGQVIEAPATAARTETTELVNAASTGDMAAAINLATEQV